MGLILPLCMIFISILFFRDLQPKRVLAFNAVFFGAYLLPSIGVPGIAVLILQGLVTAAYFTTAKTV